MPSRQGHDRPSSAPVECSLPSSADHVFAQEHLVRRIRSIGLALVDERRGLIDVRMDVVRGAEDAVRAGQVCARVSTMKLVAARHVQRIIRRQRNEHRAVAASLLIRSRPWSKNWPKNVKKLLAGADRPASGVMLGMNRLCASPGSSNRCSRRRSALPGCRTS